jgi:hypothetical protein
VEVVEAQHVRRLGKEAWLAGSGVKVHREPPKKPEKQEEDVFYSFSRISGGVSDDGSSSNSGAAGSAAGSEKGSEKGSDAGAESDGDDKGPEKYGTTLHVGDVIGCLVDLDAGLVSFSRNGSFAAPFGQAFAGVKGPVVLLVNPGTAQLEVT